MTGMFSLILRAALVVALLSTASYADTREERLAVAQDYTENTIADMDMDNVIRTMWEPILPMMGITATNEQKAEIQALYMEVVEPRMIDILNGQAAIMADLFTLEELEALRDFYATPRGRSIMQKLPEVMKKVNPEIIAMVQETMPNVLPKVKEILEVEE